MSSNLKWESRTKSVNEAITYQLSPSNTSHSKIRYNKKNMTIIQRWIAKWIDKIKVLHCCRTQYKKFNNKILSEEPNLQYGSTDHWRVECPKKHDDN